MTSGGPERTSPSLSDYLDFSNDDGTRWDGLGLSPGNRIDGLPGLSSQHAHGEEFKLQLGE